MDQLRVINDFEAIAHALPQLRPADLATVGGGEAEMGAPVVVIGPGTGLGVGLRVPAREGAMVVSTEGGHACLGARDETEAALLHELLRSGLYPSRELLISGAGLERLHRLVCGYGVGERLLEAATIQQRAVEGNDATCVAALQHFCAFLGTAAGDQALGCGARGGVFIAGGIVRRFVPFLRQSAFRSRFEERGPMTHYAQRIPTWVICHDNPGLLGAAHAPL
jgi:glucokinase